MRTAISNSESVKIAQMILGVVFRWKFERSVAKLARMLGMSPLLCQLCRMTFADVMQGKRQRVKAGILISRDVWHAAFVHYPQATVLKGFKGPPIWLRYGCIYLISFRGTFWG